MVLRPRPPPMNLRQQPANPAALRPNRSARLFFSTARFVVLNLLFLLHPIRHQRRIVASDVPGPYSFSRQLRSCDRVKHAKTSCAGEVETTRLEGLADSSEVVETIRLEVAAGSSEVVVAAAGDGAEEEEEEVDGGVEELEGASAAELMRERDLESPAPTELLPLLRTARSLFAGQLSLSIGRPARSRRASRPRCRRALWARHRGRLHWASRSPTPAQPQPPSPAGIAGDWQHGLGARVRGRRYGRARRRCAAAGACARASRRCPGRAGTTAP